MYKELVKSLQIIITPFTHTWVISYICGHFKVTSIKLPLLSPHENVLHWMLSHGRQLHKSWSGYNKNKVQHVIATDLSVYIHVALALWSNSMKDFKNYFLCGLLHNPKSVLQIFVLFPDFYNSSLFLKCLVSFFTILCN